MTAAPTPVGRRQVREEVLAVCAHYLGPGKATGASVVWTCPSCGKRKFEASELRGGGVAGCWNSDCAVPNATDALGVVAHFESLDLGRDYREALRRAASILWPADGARRDKRIPSRTTRRRLEERRRTVDADLAAAVYREYLVQCPLTKRVARYLLSRGLDPATVRAGRFGAADPRRTAAAVGRMRERFGDQRLLEVPGFFRRKNGSIGFTLGGGEYLLIPYHDRQGRVTTVEGRFVGSGEPPMDAKYVSLRDSGAHLYLFPGHHPDGIQAFTEGPMGAIVAARYGISIGAIKGIRNHRRPDGKPLPELEGANLGGRLVPYVPDHDDPPKTEVLEEAPKAARSLTEPFGGVPGLLRLPRGLDLDGWMLSVPHRARTRALQALIGGARPLRE